MRGEAQREAGRKGPRGGAEARRGISIGGLVIAAGVAVGVGCGDPEMGGDAGGMDAGRDAMVAADATVGPGLDAALPTCEVLAALTDERLKAPAAGSGEYVPPDVERAIRLESAIAAGVAHDRSSAEGAYQATYRYCLGTGVEEGLILFEPMGVGHARIVVRPEGAPLILEAPHPFYDTDTLDEALVIFEALGARALIVSGTHRCASDVPSGCDGSTAACGATAPYVESDMAHATDAFFQSAHETLARLFPDDVIVSVHGFADDGASVSDGTNDPVAADAPSARLARALSARFDGVTSCNDGAGVPTVERLCGTTNVQGRHLNGAADACTDAAPRASGRFVHLEQSRLLRGDPATVAAAFAEAFP